MVKISTELHLEHAGCLRSAHLLQVSVCLRVCSVVRLDRVEVQVSKWPSLPWPVTTMAISFWMIRSLTPHRHQQLILAPCRPSTSVLWLPFLSACLCCAATAAEGTSQWRQVTGSGVDRFQRLPGASRARAHFIDCRPFAKPSEAP